MKNPNLTHVRVGDRILVGGAETEITAIFDDGAGLSDGRRLSEHDFFEDGMLVIPQEAPAAMRAMIEAQPAERVQELVVVRRLSGRDEPQFTVADRSSGRLLRSAIRTEEDAELSFCSGEWEEGKPEVIDCSTEYVVGDREFQVPDGFDPRRYV